MFVIVKSTMFVIVSNTKTNKKLIQKFLFRCWLDLGWVWAAISRKSKISPSQCVSCRFRLPLPREKSFLIACHPSRLLLCHEVCKHPGHLPDEPDSLLPQNVESLEVLLQKAGLEVFWELEARKSMEASHCVCSVLGDHQRLPVRLSPPSQGGDNLSGDQLGWSLFSKIHKYTFSTPVIWLW